MAELPTKHPKVYEAFENGCFTAQKTNKRFSCIPLDQVHEQENVKVKGVGGAMHLLNEQSALNRWLDRK